MVYQYRLFQGMLVIMATVIQQLQTWSKISNITVAPQQIMPLYLISLINPLQNMSVVQLMRLNLWEWALLFQSKTREWQKHFLLKSGFLKKTGVYATLTKDTEVAAGSSATDLTFIWCK